MRGASGPLTSKNGVRLDIETWPSAGSPPLRRVVVTDGATVDIADALVEAYPGGAALFVDREDLSQALHERGGVVVRHLHVMRHTLAAVPEQSDLGDLTLRPWQAGDGTTLAAAYLGAYGPGHPDPAHGDVAEADVQLRRMADDPDNPLIAHASLVAAFDGEPVGAAVVVHSSHFSGFKGPWLMNVFRSPVPMARGAGAALVTAVLRAIDAAGEDSLGLAVTHTNGAARALYERLGFEYSLEGRVVALPAPFRSESGS